MSKTAKKSLARAIEYALPLIIGAITYADIFLAAPGVPRGFVYVALLPFLVDLPRVRKHILTVGLICAALSAAAVLAKWHQATIEQAGQMLENRMIMVFCIGALTHLTKRFVHAEDRTLRIERIVERLDQGSGERLVVR